MDDLFRSIQALQKRLGAAGIPSIVIGGVAVAAWGDPRVTRDVDLKVLLAEYKSLRSKFGGRAGRSGRPITP